MKCWTFDFLRKKNLSFVYPEENNFWLPLYISLDPLHKIEFHYHEFIELALVCQGKARHSRSLPNERNRKRDVISAGDLFGFMPGEGHEYHSASSGWYLIDILFDPSIFGANWDKLLAMPGLDHLLNKREILHLSPACFEDIHTTALHLQQEIYRREKNYEINLIGLMQDLLIRIGRSPDHAENLKTNIYTDKAVQYIRRHYAEKITLNDIARYSGISRKYLCTLFQKKKNSSVWDFLNRVRVERAKFYMQTMNNARIGEIAAMCGFENNSYFAKIFRETEGMTPRVYLAKKRPYPKIQPFESISCRLFE